MESIMCFHGAFDSVGSFDVDARWNSASVLLGCPGGRFHLDVPNDARKACMSYVVQEFFES